MLLRANGTINPAVVVQDAIYLASAPVLLVPANTRVLDCTLQDTSFHRRIPIHGKTVPNLR